ncbi:MAG: ATP-binding cassette domain-containing protein [Bacteroidia bacterium]|nr:ATP-binding cassette domain-containing protein [Bacteroidia bacterium]
MKPIIEIKNISKKFLINNQQKPYLSIREDFFNFFNSNNIKKEFWALRDVSFSVNEGESIAIIGKNGAGKSTLLKILSKITPPTKGKIVYRGRISSLLEVGTGFHPELSGRENVMMNGSILGMRRHEILKNFDAIVDFAGVENFIDTPLKHYSSGMQLRLAFAVAAFLENEILIIDEVLAVGDADFQKKCISKMDDVSNSGRTLLFVSHNITAVKALCKKAVLLDKGTLNCFSDTNAVLTKYIETETDLSHRLVDLTANEKSKSDIIDLNFIKIICDNELITVSDNFEITFENFVHQSNINIHFSLLLSTFEGVCVFNTGSEKIITKNGKLTVSCSIPGNLLNDGAYKIRILIIKDGTIGIFDFQDIMSFKIADNTRDIGWYGKTYGIINPKLNWNTYD